MNSHSKIVNLVKLRSLVKRLKKRKKRIVFTNGCFDILHPGHISYLERCKTKNSILIVGLNSDSSVKKIKDQTRPIISQLDRAKVLAALTCVDYVVIFNQATPLNLITTLKPDILIKGADWKDKGVVGEKFVEAYGGKVKLISYLKNYSTTKIIQRILKACQK